MAGTKARHAASTRKAMRRVASVCHISTPNIARSKTNKAVLCGSSIQASGSGNLVLASATARGPATSGAPCHHGAPPSSSPAPRQDGQTP
jgi:L-lactate utilization protein LutC